MRSVPLSFYQQFVDKSLTNVVQVWEIIRDAWRERPTLAWYFATWNRPVTYAPVAGKSAHVYAPYPTIAHGDIEENLGTELANYELTLPNLREWATGLDLPWSSHFAADDLNRARVTMRLISLDHLNDPTAQFDYPEWTVSGAQMKGTVLRLPLGPGKDLLREETPGPRLKGNRCIFDWKGRWCGSKTSHSACGKVTTHCIDRHPDAPLRISQPADHEDDLVRKS